MSTQLQSHSSTTVVTAPVAVGCSLQRKCACGGFSGFTGECVDCDQERLSLVRKPANFKDEIGNPAAAPPIVSEAPRSSGQPLDAETGAFMEPRFGHDFSKVRVGISSRQSASAETPGRIGKIAQDPISAGVSSSAPDSSPAPTAEAAGACEFSINYENRKDMKCDEMPGYEGQVGAAAVYDITGVTATGSGCPRTLDGLRLTETIKSDGGCSGQSSVERGEGCVITSELGSPRKGKLNWCQDTYAICGPSAGFPAGQCTEQFTQQTFIGGSPAETRQITFRFSNDGTSVFGLLSRS